MKSEIIETIVYKLELTQEEANWLKALVQNPVCDPSQESKEDKEMRQNLFKALTKTL